MILSTVDAFPNRAYTVIGLVDGSTVQTVNALRDIGAGLKTLIGGELKKYNEMMAKARELATARMTEKAEWLNADAVIGVRYTTASIMEGAAEVMAYGTAIRFDDKGE